MILNPRQELFPPSFKGTMKSSIIKAVTQNKFETCVTAFISLDFKLMQKGCPDGIWGNFLVRRLSFNYGTNNINSYKIMGKKLTAPFEFTQFMLMRVVNLTVGGLSGYSCPHSRRRLYIRFSNAV